MRWNWSIQANPKNSSFCLVCKWVYSCNLIGNITVKRPRMLSTQFVALNKPCKPKPELPMYICVIPPQWVKGAVSYRFSQGLLTLMCNNSKLKADINFFYFLLRRQTSKVYTWLQKFTIQHPVALLQRWGKTHVFHNFGFNSETILPISIFLFDNDIYMPSPQNDIRVCQLEFYFWKYFIFCIKYIFFPVFSFCS